MGGTARSKLLISKQSGVLARDRSERRLYQRTEGDCGSPEATVPPLPVLEHCCADDCGSITQGPGLVDANERTAGAPLFQYTILSRKNFCARLRRSAGRPPPFVPVMLGDAALATKMAERLLQKGVYVVGFSYPVVPQGEARIRVQLSTAHTREDLEFATEQFAAVRQELSLA